MAKFKIPALEYIRGISMLGVVGIHTGAYSLSNPNADIHLFALLEIFTRFSVPIFFFVSAFGLFLGQNLKEPFHYSQFMQRRCKGVLLPYLSWSILYMLHYTYISNDTTLWSLPSICEYLFFGLASYQLYFLVILLWFYALMPLWRWVLKWVTQSPLSAFSLLFVLQIAFNYYSSYLLVIETDNYYIQKAIYHRLSYWVLHYLLVFISGGFCALHYETFKTWVIDKSDKLKNLFFFCLLGMLALYYYLVLGLDYTLEQAVNTDHQLSPIGVAYTLSASLFWFSAFSQITSNSQRKLFSFLGNYSYLVYLVHPLAMYYIDKFFTEYQLEMTVPVTILFFLLTITLSIGCALLIRTISKKAPIIGLLLEGQYTKKVVLGS